VVGTAESRPHTGRALDLADAHWFTSSAAATDSWRLPASARSPDRGSGGLAGRSSPAAPSVQL